MSAAYEGQKPVIRNMFEKLEIGIFKNDKVGGFDVCVSITGGPDTWGATRYANFEDACNDLGPLVMRQFLPACYFAE